ncbi:MAG: hypothetical protein AB1593_04570 [Pseudomonadota bacterium]
MSAVPQPRCFLLSTGRCGSSLLAAILTEAGADFGERYSGQWNERTGAFESFAIGRATAHYQRSLELRRDSHLSKWRMWRRKWHRGLTRIYLQRALRRAAFAKCGDSAIPLLARKLGYRPSVVFLYRHYVDQTFSAHQRHGSDYVELIDKYFSRNATALMTVQFYGGCVVSYEEIMDANETAWAAALARATGLEADRILASRAKIVRPQPPATARIIPPDARADALLVQLAAFKGRYVEPDRLAQRV